MKAADQITLAGAVIALVALLIGVAVGLIQQTATARVARGHFLLQLHDAFSEFDDILKSLVKARSAAVWAPQAHDWVPVMKYLGLFERCQLLIEWHVLDVESFERLYSYRLRDICNRPEIREEFFGPTNVSGWSDFIRLWTSVREAYIRRLGPCAQHWEQPPDPAS